MTEHPVVSLWRRHATLDSYPAGVLAVPSAIVGRSFFPGGYGLWAAEADKPLPDFPVGGIMILGHDFHSEVGYRASLARGREDSSQPTWRNLVSVLQRAGVELERCFFTNYYMGLREGKGTTGPFPGAKDSRFVNHCRSFLLDQIQTQRPELILTLGINTPEGIAALSPDLAEWGHKRGLKHLDAVGALQRNVRFPGIPGFATTVVALTHPSLRHASVRHRRYRDLIGDEAEIAMIKDAVANEPSEGARS